MGPFRHTLLDSWRIQICVLSMQKGLPSCQKYATLQANSKGI
eukprot:CCRYP_013251-RA/>CCRYP_013251-RA protein AED:0.36 eAED:1.00 QI:0/-1/0/1/-1/0/1/0/41